MRGLELFVCFLIIGCSSVADGYRILGIFPFCARSHQMMYDALSKGLAKRGHRVDIVTCFPPKETYENLTVVMNVDGSQPRNVNNWTFDQALDFQYDVVKMVGVNYGNELCPIMGREEIQRIVKNPPKNPPYDLVIVEALAATCFAAIGTVLKAPVVFTSTSLEMPWIDRALGNPNNLAYLPAFFGDLSHPFTFWERTKNVVDDVVTRYRYDRMTGDTQTEIARKYLGPDIPHVRELERRVTLVLVNTFFTLTGVRPTLPGIVEVGGLHIEDKHAKLSKELKEWLDESKDGVVYFTLGSMVNIETMPESVIVGLYAAFEKIAPVRVLMKVADKDKLPPGQPKNLITLPWIPQVPVLAHKNTRVFITHGGLMSTQEALYHGVPLIGIPLFGDQLSNLNYYTVRKMALFLDVKNLNERTLTDALNEVLNNPSYKKAAKIQSARFRDRPMSALETAIFWIEYTIRNGPEILRSPAADLTWWQNDLLDVYAFLFMSLLLGLFVAIFIVNYLVRKIRRVITFVYTPLGKIKRN